MKEGLRSGDVSSQLEPDDVPLSSFLPKKKKKEKKSGEIGVKKDVEFKKKKKRGRPRLSDAGSDKEVLVSTSGQVDVEFKKVKKRGRPRLSDAPREVKVEFKKGKKRGRPRLSDAGSDNKLLLSVPYVERRGRKKKNADASDSAPYVERRGRKKKNADNSDSVVVVKKRGRKKKNADVSDSVVVVKRRGRKKKNTDVSDAVVVVEKNSVGCGKRKRKPKFEKKSNRSEPVENSGGEEISGDDVEQDENQVKKSRMDVFEYNEDDLVEYKTMRNGSESEHQKGVKSDKRNCSQTDKENSPSKERDGGINVSCNDMCGMEEVKTKRRKYISEEKSSVSSGQHMSGNGKNVDSLVRVNKNTTDRSAETFDPSETEENKTSKSVEDSIGKRTRSAVNAQKNVDKVCSSTILEKDKAAKELPAKKSKQHMRKVDKDALLQHEPGTEVTPRNRKKTKGQAISTTETVLRKERKRNVVKELIRNQIKRMVESAGWTIDYRLRNKPRNNTEYKDVVYIDHNGCTYWSVLKAYYALQKQYENKESDPEHGGTGFRFTPIPQQTLDKLTRLTKKRIEREQRMKIKAEKENKKAKGTNKTYSTDKKCVKKSKGSCMNRETVSTLISRDGRSLKGRLKTNGFNLNGKKGLKKGLKRSSYNHNSDKVGSGMNNGMTKPPEARKNKTQRGYTLLVRKSDKDVNANGGVQFIAYTGKRTVFSWLVDLEIVSLGSKVKYMKKRGKQALLEGWITKDGIKCGCCSEIVTISKFEIHAGSKLCQASQNIFAETGVSLFQCQIDAWNKQEESERSGYHCIDVTSDDPNDDTCGLCGDGGDLICCDGCPSTFHQSCLGIQVLPNGDWHCFNCCCKFCGLVGCRDSEKDDAAISKLLTCSLCEEKYHSSCTLQRAAVSDDSDSLYSSYCGQNCKELFETLQKLLGVKHELEEGFSWTLVQRSDLESDTSLCGLTQKVECNSKLALALSVMDECFLPTIDERSGINLLHNVVYNCGSNFNRLNYSGFYTFLLERGDELISAASIRVHGTRFAEMPFIGTRHMYRRQGMCRRLLNAIESCLGSLNVEKLIIPAISELMDTWTIVFGFSPLEESHRLELRSVNMIVFPGVQLLQKLLLKHISAEIMVTDGSVMKTIGSERDNHTTAEAIENSDPAAAKHDNCSDLTVDQNKNGDIIVYTDLQAPRGLVQDSSGASERDNHTTPEAIENSDTAAVKHGNCSDLTVDQNKNKDFIVETGLQAPGGLVQDSFGASEKDNLSTADATQNSDTSVVKHDNCCSDLTVDQNKNGDFIVETGLEAPDGLVQDSSGASERDNHTTAEATENSDSAAVKHGNRFSDLTIDQNINGDSIVQTDLQASSGLVQDTSGASERDNHATEEATENSDTSAVKRGNFCSDLTVDQSKSGDLIETGLQAPGGLVQDTSGAREIDNHTKVEATENSDTVTVKRAKCSDLTVDQRKNGGFIETDLQAPDGLVQDTSGASDRSDAPGEPLSHAAEMNVPEEVTKCDHPVNTTEPIFQNSSESSCISEPQHKQQRSTSDIAKNITSTGSKCMMIDFIDLNSQPSGEGDGGDVLNVQNEVDLDRSKVTAVDMDTVHESTEVIRDNEIQSDS